MKLSAIHGSSFLELGQGSLFEQCRTALKMIAGDDEDRRLILLDQFAYFLASRMEESDLLALSKLKPALIWAQVDDNDMCDLAAVLVQVYNNPAGAVGGDRNHKTKNRVHSKQRVRLGAGKCEKQVAIAFTSAQLKWSLAKRRVTPYTMELVNTGREEEELCIQQSTGKYEDEETEGEELEDEDEDIGQGEFRMVW